MPTDASVWEKGNAETLDRFVKVMASEFRYSPQTVRNVVSSLRWLPGKAWSELEAEDLLATEERMRAHLKPKTVKIRKIHIRVFMRWLAGLRSKRQDHPGIPDSWKGGNDRNQGRKARSEEEEPGLRAMPDELFLELLKAADNPRDRAILVLIRRSGIRREECRNLDIGDFQILGDNEAHVFVRGGKTGTRTVPVEKWAIAEVREWLKVHPSRGDPTAPLFVSLNGGSRGHRISAQGLGLLWERMKRKLALSGVHVPSELPAWHSLRHARVYQFKEESEGSIEDAMRFFGWRVPHMFFLYGRRKPEDMLRKWRQSHGIEPPPSRSDVIRGNVCPNCHVEWPPTYEHCPTCGRPVSEKAKSLVTEQPRQTDELADLSSKLLDRVDRMEKELAAARAFQDIVESSPEGKSLMARILAMMKKKAQADRL